MLKNLIASKNDSALLGTLISINSCEMVEALSCSGLDWLFFDLEHAVYSIADVQKMIQAIRPPCLSFIRIQDPQPVYVKKALDTGCSGIIVPQVNSVKIAKSVVDAGKYYPLGARSVGLGRSTLYGSQLAKAIENDNSEKAIIVQIEHIDAVNDLNEILNIDGIDAAFVGPYDLSSSMGLIGDVQNTKVQEAIDKVASTLKNKKIIGGIFVGSDQAIEKEVKRGFKLIAVGSDIIRIVSSCKSTMQSP